MQTTSKLWESKVLIRFLIAIPVHLNNARYIDYFINVCKEPIMANISFIPKPENRSQQVPAMFVKVAH